MINRITTIAYFLTLILSIHAQSTSNSTLHCPSNCSGIGICNNGICDCPIVDPSTGIRWFTPPTDDCAHYGASAYGIELITFQISWALLYLFGFGVMLAINIQSYRENGYRLPKNVKAFCFALINLGFAVRALFYMIDPYSLRSIVTPIVNRILYNVFYPIVLMAYCSMLLQWIEICNPESKYVQGRYLSGTKIVFGVLVALFIIMEIVTSFLQAHSGEFPIYFIVYYSFAGLIVLITVPFYIYFGNHFRKHLRSYPNADRDKSIQQLSRKILLLTYGPAILLIITFVVIGLTVKFTRKNATLFLIGESFARFSEMITLGVFVFALFTERNTETEEEQDVRVGWHRNERREARYGKAAIPFPQKVIVK